MHDGPPDDEAPSATDADDGATASAGADDPDINARSNAARGRRSDDSSRAGDGADDDGIPLSGPCRSITPCTALSEAVPGISTGIIQGIL